MFWASVEAVLANLIFLFFGGSGLVFFIYLLNREAVRFRRLTEHQRIEGQDLNTLFPPDPLEVQQQINDLQEEFYPGDDNLYGW